MTYQPLGLFVSVLILASECITNCGDGVTPTIPEMSINQMILKINVRNR